MTLSPRSLRRGFTRLRAALRRGFTRLCPEGLRRGFTLIELILAIAIIAILAAVVIIAINPTKQLAAAMNAQRRSDINAIMNAISQYSVDQYGAIPSLISTNLKDICKSGVSIHCGGDGISLNVLTGTYIVAIPSDPRSSTATGTNYFIQRGNNDRLTITAPGAENGQTISVIR